MRCVCGVTQCVHVFKTYVRSVCEVIVDVSVSISEGVCSVCVCVGVCV